MSRDPSDSFHPKPMNSRLQWRRWRQIRQPESLRDIRCAARWQLASEQRGQQGGIHNVNPFARPVSVVAQPRSTQYIQSHSAPQCPALSRYVRTAVYAFRGGPSDRNCSSYFSLLSCVTAFNHSFQSPCRTCYVQPQYCRDVYCMTV